MVEKALDEDLRETFHNAERGVRSVMYNVLGQAMLDLLQMELLEKLQTLISQNYLTRMKRATYCRRFC